MLLAQCFGSGECQLPHSPPWWLTLAFVVAWMALVVGTLLLAARQLRVLRQRRRGRRRPVPGVEVELRPSEEIERS